MKTRFCSANYKRLLPFLDAVDRTEGKHFKFTSSGYMPLSIEYLGYSFARCPVYSMMHFYTQNGDLMRDPDMTFYVDRQGGRIIPMTYQLDAAALYQEVFDGPGLHDAELLRDLDDFLNVWTKNIIAQGFDPEQTDAPQDGFMTPEQFADSIDG